MSASRTRISRPSAESSPSPARRQTGLRRYSRPPEEPALTTGAPSWMSWSAGSTSGVPSTSRATKPAAVPVVRSGHYEHGNVSPRTASSPTPSERGSSAPEPPPYLTGACCMGDYAADGVRPWPTSCQPSDVNCNLSDRTLLARRRAAPTAARPGIVGGRRTSSWFK